MMVGGRDPEISVVLATDRYETIGRVMERLRRQTVRDRIELVIVGPGPSPLAGHAGELEGFAAARHVEVESVVPLARARAAGVRAASAPLVFIGETHSFARPDTMEAFIRAQARRWSVVVPGFANANPDGRLSWAAFVMDYGSWWEGLRASPVTQAPSYNIVAERSVLLEFGDGLERVFGHGNEFLAGLRERGHSIYFEPAVGVEHLNGSTLRSLRPRFLIGRVRGADRGAEWGLWRRAAYVLGSPLIPAVLLWRLRKPFRSLRERGELPVGTAIALGSLLALSALGEMVGYAIGAGPESDRRVDQFEIHKRRYVKASLRQGMDEEP